jgi:hypothetical protein
MQILTSVNIRISIHAEAFVRIHRVSTNANVLVVTTVPMQ